MWCLAVNALMHARMLKKEGRPVTSCFWLNSLAACTADAAAKRRRVSPRRPGLHVCHHACIHNCISSMFSREGRHLPPWTLRPPGAPGQFLLPFGTLQTLRPLPVAYMSERGDGILLGNHTMGQGMSAPASIPLPISRHLSPSLTLHASPSLISIHNPASPQTLLPTPLFPASSFH